MANGDTLLIFTALHGETPSSNFATFDFRNRHPVLDFDGTTNESIIFTGVMPENYSGNGVIVVIFYTSDGTTGDLDWDVAWERMYDYSGSSGIDIDSDNFAAANSGDNNTVPGTSGVVDYESIYFSNGTDMDSVDAGDLFRIKVTRDAASDTSTVDAQVLAVHIVEYVP